MLDLFSGGGGGWCLAARVLGIPSIGIEWDGPACGTRAAAGLLTIRADVATYPAERFAGRVVGITGGPPCQSFSSAGKRRGLDDPRGQLVHEPMRFVRAIRPRWVALEQVPEVLGYWRWISRELRELGYSTWAGVLNAAVVDLVREIAVIRRRLHDEKRGAVERSRPRRPTTRSRPRPPPPRPRPTDDDDASSDTLEIGAEHDPPQLAVDGRSVAVVVVVSADRLDNGDLALAATDGCDSPHALGCVDDSEDRAVVEGHESGVCRDRVSLAPPPQHQAIRPPHT